MKEFKNYCGHGFAYNTYVWGNDKLFPNSKDEINKKEEEYPWTDPKLVCKYNITDTSSATTLRTEYEPNNFKSMEIDGVLLDSLVTSYQFNTTGEHIVKYELYDETKVGNNTPLFNNITTLTSVSIPNSVTSIGQYAFNSCGLTSVKIPDSVTTIGQGAFQACISLTSITIPDSVTSFGSSAFNGCHLTSITISDSVTSIDTMAFNCYTITSIVVNSGNSVYDSRNNCNAIIETATNTLIAGCQNTIIPNNITSIGNSAFSYCSSLTSITIPDSVTSIDIGAFSKCNSLTSVTIQATTPPTINSCAFCNNASSRKIYVPSESVDTYKAASGWSTYASDIEAIPD